MPIEKPTFGRSGHPSTRTIFGGVALFAGDPDKADRVLDVLLSYGVNHIDTAAGYGESESMIGRWLGRHRSDFFLATKTGSRSYQDAKNDIHRSLERLRVDRVDLLQLHALFKPHDWEQAMAPGGALEAAIEAQSQGLTRLIGVTAHSHQAPAMHLKSLERFDFDSVLLPCNFPLMELSEYAGAFERLYALAKEEKALLSLGKQGPP